MSWPGRSLRCDRRRSWGSTLRSVAPARQALDPHRIRMTHLPFSERRPDDFCRGIGCAVHGSDLRSSPTFVSDSRSRPFAAASGFSKCLASNPFRSVSLDRAGRDCRGLRPLSGVPARRVWRCSRGLEVPGVGRQPPEIRFRLLSALELGLVSCFEMRLTDTSRDAFIASHRTCPTAY